MYESYSFDGEIHVLNESYAYASKRVLDSISPDEFVNIKDEFTKKYVEYLFEVDKELCFKIVYDHFRQEFFYKTPEYFQFVYKPSYVMGHLSQNALFTIKFERKPNDEKFFEKNEVLDV